MLKKLAVTAIAAVTLGIPFVFAAPASAATLPSGDALYALSCDDGDGGSFAEVFLVDADTADLTYVAETSIDEDCAGPGAMDPTTGATYYISWSDAGGLAHIDLATGAAILTPITGDSDPYPDSLAIGLDGKAWIISGDELYSVDLTTAVTTYVATMTESCLYDFALDPSNGKFYVMECTSHEAFELATDGTLTSIGTVTLPLTESYALQIDTSGRWWMQAEIGTLSDTSLWSSPRPSGATLPELEGDLYDSEDEYAPHIDSLILTYPPRPLLPATGTDATPLLAGALGLLVVGGVFAVTAVRRRRAA